MPNRPTILLVEDETNLRAALGRFLTTAGYTVLAASAGEEARGLYASDNDVRLVITDVRLPDMYGRRLANRLAEDGHPDLPVLYISGHPAEIAMDAPLKPHERFLQKPIEFVILLEHVRTLLARPSP